MATCNLTMKAENGESSILFKDLVTHSNNPKEAIEQYFYTKTDEFKSIFGEWEKGEVSVKKLDANGEPKYSEFTSEAYSFDTDYSEIAFDKKLDVYKKVLDIQPEILAKIENSLKYLKSEHKKDQDHLAIAKLESIQEMLETEDISVGVPKFVGMAKEWTQRLAKRADQIGTKKGGRAIDIRALASVFKNSESYGIVQDVQDMLSTYEGVMEVFEDTLLGEVSQVLANMKTVESIYISKSKDHLVDQFHSESPNWSKEDIRQWLNESPMDVKTTELYLEYAGDSRDKVISHIATMVKNTENAKRRAVIDFNLKLEEVQEALEKENPTANAEKMYGQLIYKDKEGTLNLLDIDAEEGPQFEAVQKIKQKQPALYDFLEFFTETYQTTQKMTGVTLGSKLPSVLKSTLERSQGKGIKEKSKFILDEWTKNFYKSNQDLERGQYTDGAGNLIKKIPVFYTHMFDTVDKEAIYKKHLNKLLGEGAEMHEAMAIAEESSKIEATKNHAENVTQDLASSLQHFHAMAVNYSTKNAVISTIEAAKAVVGSSQRKYTVVDSGGKVMLDKSRLINGEYKPQQISGPESNAFKMLNSFTDMQIYGKTETYEGTINVGKKKVDSAKFLRFINNFTSLVQMSFNTLASIANLGNGEYNNWMEAIGGEYFKLKDLIAAGKEYRNGLGGIMSDIGQRTPRSRVGVIIEGFDMLQDFQPKGTIKATERTSAVRLLKTNAVFFQQNAGEHIMQVRAGLAILAAQPMFTKDGEAAGTLLENIEVKNGKHTVKPGLYTNDEAGNRVEYDTAQEDRITNKMHAVVRKLHGNYNKLTANKMKEDARTALVMKYRDWAYEGIVRRFGKKQPYAQLGQDVEGFWRTGYNVSGQLLKDIKGLEFQLAKENYQSLSAHEKANLKRLVTEIGMMVALAVAGALLGSAGKGIRDEYDSDDFKDRAILGAFNLLDYEVNRLYTEVAAYVNPMEALRLAQTPAAMTSILESSGKLIMQTMFAPFEQYKAGHRKGQYKVGRRLEALTPIYKNIKVLTPEGIEEKGVFYEI